MGKDDNHNISPKSSTPKETDTNKSFVKKVGSRVSGFIPSSLSKWFSREDSKSSVRFRDDDDEESFSLQPPLKKPKIPSDPAFSYNNFTFSSLSTPTQNTHNNFSNAKPSQNNFNFSQPVPGPSGIKSRKLNIAGLREVMKHRELANGDKDSDSGDSTSGYSSMARIGSREQVLENALPKQPQNIATPSSKVKPAILANTPTQEENERSLFHDRSLTPQTNTSLSSRRPSFSTSTFGSPSFVDRTLATKRILNSPFYSGQTVYGGASAYGRKLGGGLKDSNLFKNSVQVKPVNEKHAPNNITLSKTARRILDTLEQYTTPVSDAKRIPQPAKSARQEGLLSKYTGVNPYIREHKGPTIKELQVPTVSELLKMKLKEQLQDSTVAVRQIASTSKSELNKKEYKLKETEEEKPKHTNKIKTKVASVRQKPETKEETEQVKLPNVTLPISTLPKFDFSLPPPPSFAKSVGSQQQSKEAISSENSQRNKKSAEVVVSEKVVPKEKRLKNIQEYKFSDPLILAENLQSIISINNFKFSEPILKKPLKSSIATFISSSNSDFKIKKVNPRNNGEIQTAPKLMATGSVMDILGRNPKSINLLDKFKPQEGTWECSVCLIRNKPDCEKCAACESLKPQSESNVENKEHLSSVDSSSFSKESKCIDCESPKTKSSPPKMFSPLTSNFGSQFKPARNTWECETCMIRNNEELSKCAACETPKPLPKPAKNTWECETCMIRNKEELSKCIACETPKPSLKQSVKTVLSKVMSQKSDQWECSTCMVRNSADKLKCPCCETPKPGQSLEKIAPKYSFGIDKSTCQFSFGIKPTEKSEPNVNAAAVFGNNVKTTSTVPTTFSFGIKPQNKVETENTTPVETQKTELKESVEPKKQSLFSVEKPATLPQASFSFALNSVKSSNEPAIPTTEKENKTEPQNKLNFSFADSTVKLSDKTNSNSSSNIFGNPFSTAAEKTVNDASKQSATVQGAQQFILGSAQVTPKVTSTFGTSSVAFGTSNAFSAQPKQEVKPFSFSSQNSDEIQNKTPVFSFGTKVSETPKIPAPAIPPSNPLNSSAGFSFGAPSKIDPSAPAAPFTFSADRTSSGSTAFGVPSQPPVQNGLFNFGAAPSNGPKKTGFNFGSSSQNGQPDMFLFGGSTSTNNAQSAAQGGFSFGATATPNFNANAKPVFNFTQGGAPAMFSAQPSAEGMTPQRKVRKALRRANR